MADTPIVEPHAWDCFAFERGEAYEAFSRWLHMGGSRPSPGVWASLSGEVRAHAWARDGLWTQRASLYDQHVATRAVVVHVPLLAGVVPRLLGLVTRRLEELDTLIEKGGFEVVSTREALQMIRMLIYVQREIRELQTADLGTDTGDSSYDFSRLSVEELRTFQALTKKATAPEERELAHH